MAGGFTLHRCWLAAAGVALCALTFAQAGPPPVAGAENASLNDIAGTTTLVTVVLSTTGAQDKNLRIVGVYGDHLSALTEDNQQISYLFASIKEIRVQGGAVETKMFQVDETRILRPEEVKVVQRAYVRAREIFDSSSADQSVKMQAAVLIALHPEAEGKKYLEELVKVKDPATALQAAWSLYLIGDYTPPSELLRDGLGSGNRKVKTKAALLSGIADDRTNEIALTKMLQDRSSELAKYGAWALTLLGQRDCIPTLLGMITQLDPDRGKAAVFGLSKFGGEDVIQQMKMKYKSAVGDTRLRIAEVLFNLGDPMGREILTQEMLPSPTLGVRAAELLAREGHYDAMQLLRSRLAQPSSPYPDQMKARADMAGALFLGGDAGIVSEFQALLRSDDAEVVKYVCSVIVRIGKRPLLAVTQPPMEASKNDIALAACSAAIAIANPNDFRERLAQTEM